MGEISSIAQRLLQFSPDAMLVVDAEGIIRFSNETSSSMFGYTPEQLIGQPIKILIPERFHTRHVGHLSSYLHQPTSREMGARIRDLFARRADGSEFPAGIRLSPFRDDDQSFVAAAIRLINASMHKLTEQVPELRKLVSHQEAAIDGATRLLNALLDISRLESGAIEPQLSPVSLAATFMDLAREFGPAAAAKNLRLDFVDTSIVMSTDRNLFTQLLQNLIGNALKYTEH